MKDVMCRGETGKTRLSTKESQRSIRKVQTIENDCNGSKANEVDSFFSCSYRNGTGR